jgi:HD-like signal output (HDOD) protein/CheY-like chemotaxis protein
MHKKRILLADADSEALGEFQQALGETWDVVLVPNGTAALLEMEMRPCEVVVADLDLGEIDGSDLLNHIQANYPKTIRFILAREGDRERMVKQVLGTHQFLGKPLESSTLRNSIEGAIALESWIPKTSIRELIGRIRTLPTIPSLYLEVQAVLRSPDATTDQVGALIAKDMAMTTKLLQVLNSACFGLSRKITSPTEAVGLLGFETVSSMVMAIKMLSEYDKVKPVYFSIDRLWRHSTEVARTAKQITMWQTEDAALAEMAFTSGLMHDIGKVVLAANFDEQYRGAQSLARKQDLPLPEVEKEIFGASHGEIGAYLLGLWGMPVDLLEVAALHHHPERSLNKNFSALTAVHIANALERELAPDADGLVVSKLNEAYLAELGVLERVPEWRAAVAKRDFAKPDNRSRAVKTAPAKPAQKPAAKAVAKEPLPEHLIPTFSDETVPSAEPAANRTWIYGAVGVGVVVLLVLGWLSFELLTNRTKVAARTTPEPGAAAPIVTPIQAAAKPISTASPTVAAKAPEMPMVVPSPVAKPTLAFADMKLQGIFYSANHPSAIINGQRVEVNDRFGDVVVVGITSSTVTVEWQKKRKTLALE